MLHFCKKKKKLCLWVFAENSGGILQVGVIVLHTHNIVESMLHTPPI